MDRNSDKKHLINNCLETGNQWKTDLNIKTKIKSKKAKQMTL